jgi:aspartate aminotransferase
MADLSGTGDPPHPPNHIVAGPALRLVYYHQSRKHAPQYIYVGPAPDDGPFPASHPRPGPLGCVPVLTPPAPAEVRMTDMPELAAHVRDVPINQIREITEAAWRTPGAIVLSIGEPGFAVPRHILEAGMACLDRDETNYTPNAGIPALREAFAARFREHNATPIGAERVHVVDGAQQGLHFAMSLLLSPGDEILIPNPGYPTFAMTSRLLHAVPVEYPLYPEHDFQPRIQDLESLITPRTKVLILNSPSNPLGAVLGEDLTRSLVELARRHDLWIISDECYEAFTYDVPHVSPARFDSTVPGEARVFTSLTLSKTYGLTGLRIGALICPPGLDQKMNNVMESIVSCVASPSQYAALAALTGPQDYVSDAHAHYRANRDAASAVLRSKAIPFLKAQGAFYLWADVSHVSGGDVRAWTRRFLADSGVSFAPGTAFGSIGEGWIRIALCGSQAELVEGLGRLPAPAAGSIGPTAGSPGAVA